MANNIVYECDRKDPKCIPCSFPECHHTHDITHAKNFRHVYTDDEGIEYYMEDNLIITPNEYQRLAMKTCSIPYDNKEDMIRHAVFGLTSEAGEVAGIYQKVYQGHEIDREHVKKELGDCLWMIAEACTALDFSLEEVMATNIEKLRKRYPEGFDAEHSLHRAEGDI